LCQGVTHFCHILVSLLGYHQLQVYRDSVLPRHVTASVAVEQGSTPWLERYLGTLGCIIDTTTFVASAPLSELSRKFGFELATAKEPLAGRGSGIEHPEHRR
jgi:transketolase